MSTCSKNGLVVGKVVEGSSRTERCKERKLWLSLALTSCADPDAEKQVAMTTQ